MISPGKCAKTNLYPNLAHQFSSHLFEHLKVKKDN